MNSKRLLRHTSGVAYLGTRAVARLGVDNRLKMRIRLQNRIFD